MDEYPYDGFDLSLDQLKELLPGGTRYVQKRHPLLTTSPPETERQVRRVDRWGPDYDLRAFIGNLEIVTRLRGLKARRRSRPTSVNVFVSPRSAVSEMQECDKVIDIYDSKGSLRLTYYILPEETASDYDARLAC